MKCDVCQHDVYRARIMNGSTICRICFPKMFHVEQSGKLHGLLTHNPYNTKETEAYKQDLESRFVPPGDTRYDRWTPGKVFV